MHTDRIATEICETLRNLELPSPDHKWNEPVTQALCELGATLGFQSEGDSHTVNWRQGAQDTSDPVPLIAKCKWFRTADSLHRTFATLVRKRATLKVLVYDAKRAVKFDTPGLSCLVKKSGRPRESYLLLGYEHGTALMGQFHLGRIVTDADGNVQVSGYRPGRTL